nr:immunoglobulin heavy chain junction region [Mus musculus]
CTSYDGSFACW